MDRDTYGELIAKFSLNIERYNFITKFKCNNLTLAIMSILVSCKTIYIPFVVNNKRCDLVLGGFSPKFRKNLDLEKVQKKTHLSFA